MVEDREVDFGSHSASRRSSHRQARGGSPGARRGLRPCRGEHRARGRLADGGQASQAVPRRRALLSHSLAPDHSAACPSCSNSVEDTPETWLRLERWAGDSGLLNSSLMPLRHKRSLQLSRNIQRKGNGCFSGKRVRVVSGSASSSPCEAYLAPLSPAGGKTTQALTACAQRAFGHADRWPPSTPAPQGGPSKRAKDTRSAEREGQSLRGPW